MINTPYHPIMFKYVKQNLKSLILWLFEYELFNHYNDVVQNKLKNIILIKLKY